MLRRKLSFSFVKTFVLLCFVHYSQGCQTWDEVPPNQKGIINIRHNESIFLWLLPEEDFANVTFVLEQEVGKSNFSLDLKNASIAILLIVKQPTATKKGSWQHLSENKGGDLDVSLVENITFSSNSTIHYSVCGSVYTFLRPPSAFSESNAVSRAALFFFLVVAMLAALGQAIYICYKKPWKESRDDARMNHSKPLMKNLVVSAEESQAPPTRLHTDAEQNADEEHVYSEWNEHWQNDERQDSDHDSNNSMYDTFASSNANNKS